MPGNGRSRLWWAGVAAVAYFALSAVLLTFRPLPEAVQHVFASVAGIPSMTAAAVAAGLAARRGRGSGRRAWWLIAAGALCSAIGDAIWSFYELVLDNPDPFPSVADVFYLAVIPLLLFGILLLSSTRGTLGRLRTGLDACTLLAAALALGWPTLLAPALTASDAGTIGRLLSSAYPAGDILLLWALAVAIRRQWAGPALVVLGLFATGVAVFTSGDLGFAYLSLRGTYVSGAFADLGWSAGFLLMGSAAALYARRQPNLEPETGDRVAPAWRNGLPLGALLALVGWLLITGIRGTPEHDRVLLAIIAVGLVGVVARQVIVLADNAALNRDLDRRVRERTHDLQTTVDLTNDLAAARTIDDVLAATGAALRRATGGDEVRTFRQRGRASAAGAPRLRRLRWGSAGVRYDEQAGTLVAGIGSPFALALIEVGGVQRPPSSLAAVEALAVEAGIAVENAALFEQAQYDATHDPVTGLLNQRHFYDCLRSALDVAGEGRGEVSIALLDIDDFRLFNETYGRVQGDAVLKLLARVIRGRLPRGGLAARAGGDEFAVLLPYGRTDSLAFLERLQRAVERVRVKLPAATVPVRLTWGLASSPGDGTTAHALLVGADNNLVHSKRNGSRVVLSLPPGTQTLGGNYGVLVGLITAIDRRDQYTRAHCEMVSEYAARLAGALGLSADTQKSVAIAGMLHDVGKIIIPDDVLRKPGLLTEDEQTLMKQHVGIAAGLILDVPNRDEVVDGVIHHHERWDGNGYLKGLKGEAIPYIARIISVVDVYSAITLDRPYRKGLSREAGIEALQLAAGTQLDPKVTATFIELLRSEAERASTAA